MAIYPDSVKWVAEDGGEQVKKNTEVESAATSAKPVNSWTQPTLHSVTGPRVAWADDRELTQRIDKRVMDVIIVDMLPYTVVEGEAFLWFTGAARKIFRKTHMSANYDRVVQKTKQQLSAAAWISFTPKFHRTFYRWICLS